MTRAIAVTVARSRRGPVLLAMLLAAAPARGEDVHDWRAHIAEASTRFGVPVAWIERVMQTESGGRTRLGGRPITSHAGAMGLMQLMPGTWADMRRAHGLGPDPHDPRDNILAGTAYLRLMHDRFGYPGLFAAYNAGPARYTVHRSSGQPLTGETRAYLVKVAGQAAPVASAPRQQPSLFFALADRKINEAMSKRSESQNGLFAMRRAASITE